MTAPALDQDTLEVLVGPSAWAYHQTLLTAENGVDVERAYRVHGDVRLVAADVLAHACTEARRASVTGSGAGVLAVEVGKIKVKLAASTSGASKSGDANEWCRMASALRLQVANTARVQRSRSVVHQPELDT